MTEEITWPLIFGLMGFCPKYPDVLLLLVLDVSVVVSWMPMYRPGVLSWLIRKAAVLALMFHIQSSAHTFQFFTCFSSVQPPPAEKQLLDLSQDSVTRAVWHCRACCSQSAQDRSSPSV